MARIRTIKPEICTSSQFVECSTNARLMFVTMLCFFDDGGNHPANVKRLKMEIFPADYFTLVEIQGMMDELVKQGLVLEYQAGDEVFWHVTGFEKHQKIDRPNPKFPKFDDNSTKVRRKLDVQSPPEGKGTVREGIVKEETTSTSSKSLVVAPEQKAKMMINDFRTIFSQAFGANMPGGCNNTAQSLCREYTRDMILAAFETAAKQGVMTIAYVEGVLKGNGKQKVIPINSRESERDAIIQKNKDSAKVSLERAMARGEV